MIEVLAAIPLSVGATYGTYRYLIRDALKDRIEGHLATFAPRIEAQHQSIVESQRLILIKAEETNFRASQNVQAVDTALIDVRQALQRLEELEVRAATHVQHTENILNEPHIRRYLRSG